MASFSKRAHGALLALAVGLGWCSIPAAARAQDSSAAAPRASSKTANNAEFLAAADEVLQQMSEITGLKLLSPLKKSLRSREEIRAYVIKQLNEDPSGAPQGRCGTCPGCRTRRQCHGCDGGLPDGGDRALAKRSAGVRSLYADRRTGKHADAQERTALPEGRADLSLHQRAEFFGGRAEK